MISIRQGPSALFLYVLLGLQLVYGLPLLDEVEKRQIVTRMHTASTTNTVTDFYSTTTEIEVAPTVEFIISGDKTFTTTLPLADGSTPTADPLTTITLSASVDPKQNNAEPATSSNCATTVKIGSSRGTLTLSALPPSEATSTIIKSEPEQQQQQTSSSWSNTLATASPSALFQGSSQAQTSVQVQTSAQTPTTSKIIATPSTSASSSDSSTESSEDYTSTSAGSQETSTETSFTNSPTALTSSPASSSTSTAAEESSKDQETSTNQNTATKPGSPTSTESHETTTLVGGQASSSSSAVSPVATSTTQMTSVPHSEHAAASSSSAPFTSTTVETTSTAATSTATTSTETTSSAATSSSTSSAASSTTASSGVLSAAPAALVYSPYNSDNSCKDASSVLKDMTFIKSKGVSRIRIYGTDCNSLETVTSAAKSLGISINQGLWISSAGVDSIDGSVQDIISYGEANGWDLFEILTIGNEAILSGYCTIDELLNKISSVRDKFENAGYHGKFTTSEPPVIFQNNPRLCKDAKIDFVGINSHPYFDVNSSADSAGSFVKGQLEMVQEICETSNVVVTETGYPSEGDQHGGNQPSSENQLKAVQNILDEMNQDVTILSTYNDYWKHPGPYNIEQHFGISDILP